MSHWRHTMVDGAKFWISCKRPTFLSNFSHLQLIENSVPSVARWHQCDIWIKAKYDDMIVWSYLKNCSDFKERSSSVHSVTYEVINSFKYCTGLISISLKITHKEQKIASVWVADEILKFQVLFISAATDYGHPMKA